MQHEGHRGHGAHKAGTSSPVHDASGGGGTVLSLGRTAFSATVHCLTGCAIGEVLGMVIGSALRWSNAATVTLSVILAFFFGYALTMLPLLRSGLTVAAAGRLALAADTISIAIMEIVDNAIMLAVPGAMDAGLGDARFWLTLGFALAVAWTWWRAVR